MVKGKIDNDNDFKCPTTTKQKNKQTNKKKKSTNGMANINFIPTKYVRSIHKLHEHFVVSTAIIQIFVENVRSNNLVYRHVNI